MVSSFIWQYPQTNGIIYRNMNVQLHSKNKQLTRLNSTVIDKVSDEILHSTLDETLFSRIIKNS